MVYTIKYAFNPTEDKVLVELCKRGDVFVVSVADKGTWKTLERREYSRYEPAEIAFDVLRSRHGATLVEEPRQEWDATDFD